MAFFEKPCLSPLPGWVENLVIRFSNSPEYLLFGDPIGCPEVNRTFPVGL